MAEDTFKIGIDLEVDDDSLADITKRVEAALKASFESQGSGAGGRSKRPQLPAKTGAQTRSAGAATNVTAKDFGDAVAIALSRELTKNTSGFEVTQRRIIAQLERLTRVVEGQGGGDLPQLPSGPQTPPQIKAGQRDPHQFVKQQGQSGPPGSAREIFRQAINRQTQAGRERGGAGGAPAVRQDTGTTGDPRTDSLQKRQQLLARQTARNPQAVSQVGAHQKSAEQQAKSVANALDILWASVKNVGALGDTPGLREQMGLPRGKDVKVGAGASVEVRTVTGLTKTLSQFVKLVNKDVSTAGNILVERVNKLMTAPKYKEAVGKAERTARAGDPAGAANTLRREMRGLVQDPMLKSSSAQAKFERAGETQVEWEITDPGMLKELNKHRGDETAQIAYLNKVLNETPEILKKLSAALGSDFVGSVGLTEEKAAEAKVTFDEMGNAMARLTIQARDIGGMGPGGKGGLRVRRTKQPTGALPLAQGEAPRTQGIKESIAYATGLFTKNISKNMQTAMLDPAKTPEVHEDMILITKKAASQFGAWVTGQSKALAQVDPGMRAGGKLQQGDVMGYDVSGKAMEFDLHGVEAEIESIEEIIDNGVAGWRVHFKEFTELITGEKLTTPGGFKGVTQVVDEPDLSRYGAPKGAQIAISAPGEARREILQDPMRMMATELSRVVKDLRGVDLDPQLIMEGIEDAMDEGGYTFYEAVKAAAEELQIAAKFTGGQGGAMMGGMDWMRLKGPQKQGPAEIGPKYYDRPAMKALEMEAGTHGMAKQMQVDMAKVAESLSELTITLQVLAGMADAASMSLRQMLPEDFSRLPSDYATPQQLAGTMLDPANKEAMALRLPVRGGGEETLRMPQIGGALGERGKYESPLGAIAPNEITRRWDQIAETGKEIRSSEGQIPGDVRQDPEMAEAAYYQVKTQVNQALEKALEGGPEALADFVAKMMPLIDQIGGFSDDIQYYPSQGAKEAGAGVAAGGFKRGMTPSDFVRGRMGAPEAQGGGLKGAAYAARDIVAGRPPGPGAGMNVPTAGEIQNVDTLQKAMEHLNISIARGPEHIESLYQRLDMLKEGLQRMLTALVPGSRRGPVEGRRVAEQVSGGIATAPTELTAVQMRSDVSGSLSEARKQLELMATAGHNVADALSAVTRLEAAQGDVPSIPQDMIWLNQQDWDNLVNTLKEEKQISTGEAEAMVKGPGLVHRFPTTFGGSFYPAEAGVAPKEAGLPAGKIGIPGPMAGKPEDVGTVRTALKGWVTTLTSAISTGKVSGEALSAMSDQVKVTYSTLQQLNQVYRLHATNLDFDGDKITYLANAAIQATQGIETFIQKLEKGAISWEAITANIMGKLKSGGAAGAEEYGEMYEQAQGRPATLQAWTPQRAQEEASAHIGGKKTVGLFTDMFNQMALVAMHGTKEVGDTFRTHLNQSMQNINKSLARKGGGEVADPREFIEDLRTGNIGGMYQKMDEGKGIYSEMQQYNEEFRADATTGLKAMYGGAGGGAAGEEELRRFAKKEGAALPAGAIGPGSLDATIEAIVDQIDLRAFLKKLHNRLVANTKGALGMEGLSGIQIEEGMAGMMKPRGEGGAGGLDLRRAARQLEPEWVATRGSEAEEFKQRPVEQQTAQALKMLTSGRGPSIDYEMGDATPSGSKEARVAAEASSKDIRVTAKAIAAAARALLNSMKDSYGTLSNADIEDMGLSKGTRGLYMEHPGKDRPGEGSIMIRETLQTDFQEAVEELMNVSEGAGMAAARIKQVAEALFVLSNVRAHEGIHKANKMLPEFRENLVRAMKAGLSSKGVLKGQMGERGGIREALRSRSNVGGAETAWKDQQRYTREGAKVVKEYGQAQGWSAQQIKETIKGDEDLNQMRMKTKTLLEAYLRVLSEEAMAYQANTSEWSSMMTGPDQQNPLVSGKAQEYMTEQFRGLMTATGEDPRLGKATFEQPGEEGYKLYSMTKSMGEKRIEEAPDYRKERAGMGTQEAASSYDIIRNVEAALSKGLSSWGVKAAPKAAGIFGARDPGDLEHATGDTARPEMKELNTEFKQLFADVHAGAGTIGSLQKQSKRIFKELAEQYKDMETGGQVSKGTGFQLVKKKLVEFRAAMAERMINEAKMLEKAIAAAEAGGGSDPHALEELFKAYNAKVRQMQSFGMEVGRMQGPGGGSAASPFMTPRGEMSEEGISAGLAPGIEGLKGRIKDVAGRGEEGAQFMQQFEKAIMGAVEAQLKGQKQTTVWHGLLEALSEEPQNMYVNLLKLVEILGKARTETASWENGKFSEAAQMLGVTADQAKEVAKALKGVRIESKEDIITAVKVHGTKGAQAALERGRAGGPEGGMGPSVSAQYKEAYNEMEKYQRKLEKIIKTEGYRKAGRPKQFEPMEYKIKDPDSGKVLQTMRIEAKRTGKVIKMSMQQAGAAAGATSNQIRSALRRVVQWGFASGIVYGVVRAFRSVTQIIVEVQTKIASLQKVMDTATTNFEKMQDQAADFASEFGIAIGEVLDGMVVYAQQGLKMAEINERTRATLLAVNTTTLSAVEATEALTAAHKVFSSAVSESAGYVDAWASVAAHHAITAKDLANAVKRSGAAAKTAGVGFEDFMGIVTAIGAVTRQTGKEIATSTKFMFRAMRRPTAQKQLMKLDIQSQTAGGDLKPAMEVLGELAGKWENLNRAQKLNTAQAMAGIRHYNAFIVLMENWNEALSASEDAQNASGFATRKNAFAMATFAKQMASMRGELVKVSLALGKSMLPMMTAGVQAITKLVDVFGKLPDVMKTAMIVGAGLMVGFTKTANIAVDTWDAISGHGVAQKHGDGSGAKAVGKGIRKVTSSIGRFAMAPIAGVGAAAGGLKGIFTGLKGAGQAGSEMGKLSQAFGSTVKEIETIKKLQMADMTRSLGENAGGASKGVYKLAASFGRLDKAAKIATVGGLSLMLVALAGLAYIWATLPKKGADVASALEGQIGSAMQAAEAFDRQAKTMGRFGDEMIKISTLMKKLGSADNINRMFKEADFKGPHTAALKLKSAITAVANSMALIDPSAVSGLDDMGNFILGVGSGFENIAFSAADAQKSIAMALQTKVIKAFTRELREPVTLLNKIKSILGGLGIGSMPATTMGQYEDMTAALKKAFAQRNKLLQLGKSTIGVDQRINDLTSKRAEIMDEIADKAKEIKRTFEEMPIMKDMGMATRALEAPGLAEGIKLAVDQGQFGVGATESSVMIKQLAKSAGSGGMFGAEAAASPQRFLENFLEKGIGPQVTGEQGGLFDIIQETGDLVQVSEGAARAFLRLGGVMGAVDSREMTKAIAGLQAGVAEVDREGNVVIKFWDSIHDKFVRVGEDTWKTVTAAIGEQGSQAAVFLQKEMEAAAANTQKILTMGYTGAMAGIREPGNVDIGPARWSEVGTKERMLGSLPEEMQRFSAIAKQLTEHARTFNEEMSAEGMEEASRAINALNEQSLDLVMSLQQEGFKLAAAGHFNEALQDLSKTMEDVASSVEKLTREEEVRGRVARHTSGALAGMAVMGKLDFGTRAKDLSGLERIQQRRPEVAAVVQRAVQAQGAQKVMEEAAVNMSTKIQDQLDMIKDLRDRHEKLTEEQVKVKKGMMEKGLSKEAQEYIQALLSTKDALAGIGNSQLEVQRAMLDVLKLQVKMDAAAPEDKQQIYQAAVGAASFEDLVKGLAKGGAGADIDQLRRDITGIGKTGETEVKMGGRIGIPFNEREGFITAGISESFGAVNPSMGDELSGPAKATFDAIVAEMIEVEEMTAALSKAQKQRTEGLFGLSQDESAALPGIAQELDKYAAEMDVLMKALLAIPQIRQQAERTARTWASEFAPTGGTGTGSDAELNAGQVEMEAWRASLIAKQASVQADLEKFTLDAAKLVEEKLSPLQIAINIESFAKTLEDMIDGFKKAEALEFDDIQWKEKWKSDLEGPFARVGKPGFKTDFETRREEAEAKLYGGRGTREEKQAAREELDKVDFDEDEARIKQKQDRETAQLKQQQQQAESLRSSIADAIYSQDLFEGAPGQENMAKRMMETLTDQLAESEQATMRGGKLTFKGIPGLEEIKNFAASMKRAAEEKALEADKERLEDINKKSITTPLQESLRTLGGEITSAIYDTSQKLQVGDAAHAATTASAANAAAVQAGAAALPPGAQPTMPGAHPHPGAATAAGAAPVAGGIQAAAAATISAEHRAQLESLGMPVPGALGGGPAGDTTTITQAQIDAVANAKRLSGTSGMLSDMTPEGGIAPRQIMPLSDADWEAKIKTRTEEFQAQMASAAHDPDRPFVQEQTIVPRPEDAQAKQDWYKKRLAEDMLKGGLQSYAPTGVTKGATSFSDRTVDPAYTSANAAFQQVKQGQGWDTLPAVGKTNNNLAREAQARKEAGNATATTSSVITTRDASGARQEGAGTQGERDKRATGADTSGTEINISELVSAVEDNGKRLDAIVSALGGTLKTETTGEVTVAGLDEFASRVGADVTDLQSVVAQLGTVVDINGLPLDQRDADLQAQIEQAKTDAQTDFTNLQDELFIRAEVAGLDAAQQELAGLEANLTVLKDALDDAVAEGTASAGVISAFGETVGLVAQQISDAEDRLSLTEAEVQAAREEGRQAGILAVAASEKAEEINDLKLRQDDIEAAVEVFENEREDVQLATAQLLEAQDELTQLRQDFTENTSARNLSDKEIQTALNKITTAEADVRALKTVQDEQVKELRDARADLLVTKGKVNAAETKADQAIAGLARKKNI